MLQQFICITILLFKTGVGTAASSSNSTHLTCGSSRGSPTLLNSEERKGFVIEAVPFASGGLHVI
jgi:hypothetical protein